MVANDGKLEIFAWQSIGRIMRYIILQFAKNICTEYAVVSQTAKFSLGKSCVVCQQN